MPSWGFRALFSGFPALPVGIVYAGTDQNRATTSSAA
jgi:hypothetical protein